MMLGIVLGVIFVVHGSAKMKDPSKMASFWWGSKTLAFLHGAGEVLAGVTVAIHFHAGYGSAFMALIMLGAIYQKAFKWRTGFWSHTTTGWEFDLLILAGALTVLLG
jgi:uncharacterized membrane protein YphA (DoxX/SURF4 family)